MGVVQNFLVEDHARLDKHLQRVIGQANLIDHDAYREFRNGLLQHIAMEEKVLFPTIHQLRGGTPLPVAAKLRLEHGALGALIMPTPTTAIINSLRTILQSHNSLEEGPGGYMSSAKKSLGLR